MDHRNHNPTVEETKYFKEFLKAVDENDKKAISTLITKNGILKKLFPYFGKYYSFLHIVAERGTVKTAKQICKQGAYIDIHKNISKETPLFYAVRNSPAMVHFLVENGANVNFLNDHHETPLHYAVRNCSLKAVEILLKNNANVFLSTERVTALQEAIYCSSPEIVRTIVNSILWKAEQVETIDETIIILFKKKLAFYISENDYPILILFAAKFGSRDCFNLVLKICRFYLKKDNCKEINFKGREDRTALHYAVREQLPEVVRFLLENGADVNCKTKKNYTPLHYAAFVENEEICKILLSFGAQVDSSSKGTGTPLHQLCRKESEVNCGYYYPDDNIRKLPLEKVNLKIMKLLLESGSDPNASTHSHVFLLHDFCSHGSPEAIELLVQFGVDLNFKDDVGNSALHFAARNHNFEMVDFLLSKGIDINIRNTFSITPLMEVFLLKKSDRHLDIIEHLVYRGADVNARDKNDMTLLHSILGKVGSDDSVECLLTLGTIVNKLKSPFYMACPVKNSSLRPGHKILIAFLALDETRFGEFVVFYARQSMEVLTIVFPFFVKSRLEVYNLILTRIIQETPVFFHDFLTCGYDKAVRFLKNDAILKMLESREYYKEFPCYGFLIERRFQRVLELKDAISEMEDFLQDCLPFIPDLVIMKILSFFNCADFRHFYRNLESVKITEDC